jgi:hypothetical protein
MKNKTAVQWLVEQLPLSGKMAIMDKIEQAIDMEKQQHQQTAIYFYPSALKRINFEQYYKETYGK